MALMILASTLIYSISATHGSRMAADLALEYRRANQLAGFLLETAPPTPGESSGLADGFSWTRVVSEPVDTFGPGAVCERQVIVIGERDGRRFEARTSAVCPAALDT